MIESTLSKRYARALLELAEEDGKAENYLNGLKDFARLLSEQKNLDGALKNAFFEMGARQKVVEAVAAKLGFDQRLTHFIQLLVKKGRVSLFGEIAAAYQSLHYRKQGILEAIVTTAKEMPESFYQKLGQILEKKTSRKIMVRPHVDPHVLGGVSVRLGEKVYDGTVLSDLNRLESRLKGLATL